MDRLPTELSSQVVEACDSPTQLQVRTLNKSWCDIATAPAFRRVYVGLFPESIQRLRNISHSRLADNVQHLTINIETLCRTSNDEWLEFVMCGIELQQGRRVPERNGDGRSQYLKAVRQVYSAEELAAAWNIFKNRIRTDGMEMDSDIPHLVVDTTQGLKNLHKVDMRYPSLAVNADRFERFELCSPWKGTLLNPNICQQAGAVRYHEPFHFTHGESSYPLYHFMRELARRTRWNDSSPVTELDIDARCYAPLAVNVDRFGPKGHRLKDENLLRDAQNFACHLTRLNLKVEIETHDRRDLRYDEILQGMTAASNLVHLQLRMEYVEYDQADVDSPCRFEKLLWSLQVVRGPS